MSEIKISEERYLELIEKEKRLVEVITRVGGIFISMASTKSRNGTQEQIKAAWDDMDREFKIKEIFNL